MKKEREIDKDTVVAYHTRVQNQIKNELNGLNLGPGAFPMFLAGVSFLVGLVLGIIGVLVITLRHRHVYLISWNDQFLGPAFISMFILCIGFGTYMVMLANRRSNNYRRGLVFRPIGDYGVAVCHKSRLSYEQETKDQLKSGTTPHEKVKPLEPYSQTKDQYGRIRKTNGYENRGYRDDPRGPPPQYEEKERRPDDRERRGPPRDRDGPPRERGPSGDRSRGDNRRPPDDSRRGPPGDRYGDDRDRRGPRGPPRDPRDPDRRGPPRGPPRDPRDPDRRRDPRDDDRRRPEDRKRYEEDRDRRRREKEAEARAPMLEKPPLPMPGPRPPVAPMDNIVFKDDADVSSESIL